MRIAPIHVMFVVLLMLSTGLSGCFESSSDGGSVTVEYEDLQGHRITMEDGSRFYTGPMGNHTRLDATFDSVTPDLLQTGMRTTVTITASGSGALVLPAEIRIFIDDRIENDNVILFYDSVTFDVLVAPYLNVSAYRDYSSMQVMGKKNTTVTFGLEEGSDPLVSGQSWYDLEVQVTDDEDGYNGRYVGQGSPQLERAATFFSDLLESYGLEAEIQRYPASDGSGNFVINVVGFKWGTQRDEWIVMGAHFDVAPPPSYLGTWQGAYDNTAGTCAVMELARGLSQVETNRTMVFGLWSSEEEGLHGSRAFVANLPPDVTVKANINLDMVGLCYPSPDKWFHGYVFPNNDGQVSEHPEFMDYINNSIYDILGMPVDAEIFEVKEGGVSGSDHTSFAQQGIPAVFFFSGPVTHYHDPRDDLDSLIQDAGGVDLLIAGFDTALWVSFYTIIQLDDDSAVHP